MSNGSSAGEKTEEPTDKKIKDARKKGQVAKSNDVNTAWLLIVTFGFLAFFKGFYYDRVVEMMVLPTYYYDAPFDVALVEVGKGIAINFLLLVIPLLGLVAIMGIFINFVQVGPLFTMEPLKPDFKKLNPVEGAKKIFSKKNIVEFLKSILKTVFLGYLVYRVIKEVINPLLLVPYAGIAGVIQILGPILKMFAINICVAYIVVAVADIFFQRRQHIKDLKMTKDEVKREFKEMEGDPQIKGERRQLHQELAMNDTVQSTKKSSVLVTNPTHYAVAIYYNEDVTKLPVVLAKGQDYIAQVMIKTAQEEGIPIMRDPKLARELYAHSEPYNYVPSDLVQPVAVVLKWARELE
ncbi:MAG: EscU/YscU/HrcU family type III secretion system export apparatus switch protein [Verrucomicrobia bacterium]|nr:MAG: EscU/YscU/HrcU family type III secretion system export apparatus switch protein [Verrucomicrobiota bacterium]